MQIIIIIIIGLIPVVESYTNIIALGGFFLFIKYPPSWPVAYEATQLFINASI